MKPEIFMKKKRKSIKILIGYIVLYKIMRDSLAKTLPFQYLCHYKTLINNLNDIEKLFFLFFYFIFNIINVMIVYSFLL